ncbi:MAG: isochorismatase family cysteine hydrolase [Acidobacteriota bacterium]
MDRVSISEVLAASYTFVEEPAPMTRSNTALLLVDVQRLATPEHLAQRAEAAGMDASAVEAALSDYAQRFYAAVSNCQRLLHAAREAEIACIHVKIEAQSGSARDTGPAHRRLGWCYPPGSEETQILEQAMPTEGEIVITKTVSGAFTATNLDPTLRHMRIDWLIVAGFETDECIEATGRVALDLGYMALFAEDACTAYEAHAHEAFMRKYASWGLTRSTEELLGLLPSLP